MIGNQITEFQTKSQLRQPQGGLVCSEFSVRQLHVQQPVVQRLRLRTVFEQQEVLVRLFPQHAVFQLEFVLVDLDLFDTIQLDAFKVFAQFLFIVVPEHDAVLLEQVSQCFGNLEFHAELTTMVERENRISGRKMQRWTVVRLLAGQARDLLQRLAEFVVVGDDAVV